MPVDELDTRLRAAVFAHVTRLQDVHGGLIPASALGARMIFEDERVPIWSHKKGIFKPAILGQNGAALSVQTSWESPYDDAFDE